MKNPPLFHFALRLKSEDLEGFQSISRAIKGDTRLLENRLRTRAKLRDDERQFLADGLAGNAGRKRGHPPKEGLERERDVIFMGVLLHEIMRGGGREAAVSAVRSLHRISRTKVFEAIRHVEADSVRAKRLRDFCGGAGPLLQSLSTDPNTQGPVVQKVDIDARTPPNVYRSPKAGN